ncbi:MAG: TIM barrel protein [Clostridia bacterium]|nr:TIM barrel protein [Clostridia bacterium]
MEKNSFEKTTVSGRKKKTVIILAVCIAAGILVTSAGISLLAGFLYRMISTDKPGSAQTSVIPETPTAFEAPPTTEAPPTEAPETTEAPGTTEAPAMTEAPATTEPPAENSTGGPFPLGMSSCNKYMGEAFFASLAKNGIPYVEISPGKTQYYSIDFTGLSALADKYGVTLWSIHLPYSPVSQVDISSTDEVKRQMSVSFDAEIIRKAAAVGIRVMVVHPCGEKVTEEERPARMEAAKKSLAYLAETAAQYNAVIAVENMPYSTYLGYNSEDLLQLLEADSRLFICYDTNHLLQEDPIHFLEAVGNKIVTLHVSDCNGKYDNHWLPGEGVIDWYALYTALQRTGYRGPWLYEVSYEPTEYRPRIRALTAEDFARNAREIYEGLPLTVLPLEEKEEETTTQ